MKEAEIPASKRAAGKPAAARFLQKPALKLA
jgi:hypothetical protein